MYNLLYSYAPSFITQPNILLRLIPEAIQSILADYDLQVGAMWVDAEIAEIYAVSLIPTPDELSHLESLSQSFC